MSRAIHRHKQSLIATCTDMLQRQDLPEADSRGALVLAGFIADAVLATPVKTAWDLATDKSNLLLPALWAGLRCATTDPANVMDGMMVTWAALSDDKMGHALSERASIAQELQFAVPRGINEPVLGFLIEKARSNEALRWPITFTLEYLSQPLAVT
ncbi:MAG: hypothetical protein AAB067_07195, partial [Planctomycetota bacterium]